MNKKPENLLAPPQEPTHPPVPAHALATAGAGGADIVANMPYREYAASPGLRASYLADLDKGTPGKAEYKRLHQETDTAALRWGSALHAMILEPERFAAEYTIGGPVNEKTGKPYGSDTKAFMEWAAAQSKPILTREEHRLIVGMADAIAAHPLARTIRDEPRQTELSIFWRDDGLDCQARLDCVQAETIWDIKTSRDASYRGFERAISDYRYYMSAAWYMDAAKRAGLKVKKFCWLAVENFAPYALTVYQASSELLEVGSERCAATVATYLDCLDKKHFPAAYSQEPVLMAAPHWLVPNALED